MKEVLVLALLVATCTHVFYTTLIYATVEGIGKGKSEEVKYLKEISGKLDNLNVTIECEE